MHVTDKNIWIVPLEDKRIQAIIVPFSSVAANLKNLSICDQVKAITKDIDETKIKKHAELLVPSFKVAMESREVDTTRSNIKVSNELSIKGGCETCSIELISGLPSEGALPNQ